MNRQEIKRKAKEFAFKNKWNIWEPYLIIYAIAFAGGLILGLLGVDSENTLGIILTYALEFALMPMSIGYIYYLIKLVDGEKLDIKEALLSKYNIFGLIIIVSIVVAICIILRMFLLIIPGIIYAYSVIMSNYILADTANPNTKYSDVINTSREMMKGYKFDYFVFELSFIGWILFIILTCGIAAIWVYPYMQTANIMYYKELKKLKNIS